MKLKRFASIFVVAGLLLSGVSAAFAADVRVKGYTRSDGTVVRPHIRTAPNSTKADNYSTRGNTNPYTGKRGTKKRY